MKIGLFSDVHLEHRSSKHVLAVYEILEEQVEKLGLDLLVNAGDTHHYDSNRKHLRNALTTDNTPHYIEVIGNHDAWSHDWQMSALNHVHMMGDVKVFSGSMWTNFNENDFEAAKAEMYINDFRFIHGVDAGGMTARFNRFLAEIEVEKPDIVISHFGPHPNSVHPRFKGSDLNSYFCPSALDRLDHKPKLWMHGHIHDPVDYTVFDCRVVANPLGYPGESYRTDADYLIKVIEF